jgi:hypothetical protein
MTQKETRMKRFVDRIRFWMKGQGKQSRARSARAQQRARLSLEPLEARLVPSAVSLFETADPSFSPVMPVANDTSPVELGVKFTVAVPGSVGAIQFYRGASSDSGAAVDLWDGFGNLLATGNAPGNQAPGWQTVNLDHAVGLQPYATYEASYYTSTGGYAVDQNYFATGSPNRGPLLAFDASFSEAGPGVGNGFFHYGAGGGFPNQSYLSSNYWVSPVFQPDASAGPAPAIAALSLASATTAGGTVLTISGANFTPDAIGPIVYVGDARAPLSLFSANQIVVAVPPHPVGSVDVRVITDAGESDLTPNDLFTYTTSPPPPAPITAFETTDPSFAAAIPVANDSNPVELGVTFSARPGTVSAIQFYRGESSDSGFAVHLWNQSGTLLATGHAPGNQAPGWQTVNLDFPVHIGFGVYVASYYTSTGGYAADHNFQFPTRGPLALGHGVYHYGAGGGFPNQSYMSSNYWVGPVFQPDASVGTLPVIAALSLTSSPTAGGTVLTISGANFTPDAAAPVVYVGNVQAQISSFSADQIVIIIPPHAAGSVDVRIITDAGESALDPDDFFTYTM